MIDTVSCDSGHEAEVYAVETLTENTDAAAESACAVEFTEYVGVPVEDTRYTYNWFTAANSSSLASTKAICILFRADGSRLVGSAQA
jgi:hypothetical protein